MVLFCRGSRFNFKTQLMDLRIFILIGIVSCSWIIITYYGFAIKKGFPIGSLFMPDKAKNFKLFSLIAGIYFTIAGAMDFGWYYVLIIPIASFVVAFLLTTLLKKHVQLIGVSGFLVLIILNILIQIKF